MQVQSLDQEDPQEACMATRSSIFAWRIPWREESDGLQSKGKKRSLTGLSDCTAHKGDDKPLRIFQDFISRHVL